MEEDMVHLQKRNNSTFQNDLSWNSEEKLRRNDIFRIKQVKIIYIKSQNSKIKVKTGGIAQ